MHSHVLKSCGKLFLLGKNLLPWMLLNPPMQSETGLTQHRVRTRIRVKMVSMFETTRDGKKRLQTLGDRWEETRY